MYVDVLPERIDPEGAALSAILLGHAVPGRAYAADLSDGQELSTVGGAKLAVTVGNSGVTVGGSGVIATDIEAANGVIHVIDTVIVK